MKKLSISKLLPSLLFILLILTSCEKENANNSDQATQNAEQTSMKQIESTFKDVELSKMVSEIAQIAADNGIREGDIQFRNTCNENLVTGNGVINNPGQGTQFSFDWDYQFTCEGGLPTKLLYNRMATGSVTNDIFTWNGKDEGHWSIDLAQTEYILEGNYIRDGVTQSHVDQQETYTDKLTFDIQNVSLEKTHPFKITGGSGSITYTAQNTNGVQFTIPATIVFNGDNTATVTINGGDFIIRWD